MNIRNQVFESLNNALDNGVDSGLAPVETVVDDLLTYDAELAKLEPDDLRPHVVSWRHARNMGVMRPDPRLAR